MLRKSKIGESRLGYGRMSSTPPSFLKNNCIHNSTYSIQLMLLIKAEIKVREVKILELKEKIDSLEQKINKQHHAFEFKGR